MRVAMSQVPCLHEHLANAATASSCTARVMVKNSIKGGLQEGWQTSESIKVVRMAFNLYCNGAPSVNEYSDSEEQINECKQNFRKRKTGREKGNH